ncbi:MAG: hypothetical protein WAV41_01785 [Microgenomates group bacterium]
MKKLIWLWLGVILWANSGIIRANEKVVTIVNPVRSRELWKDKSLTPVETQYGAIGKYNLKATWLVQNDVLGDKELVDKLKSFDKNQELGIFLEVTKNLAYRSRVYFEEQKPWYDPSGVFLSGYDLNDRKKIIDRMIRDFENTFGYRPKSVGAWWIDSYSQQYLENEYKIKTFLICSDQKTTDSYGIWGQWWGVPYHPARDNILVPGESKAVVIQWAQRDLEKAYEGSGPKVSNYSLQANDYLSQNLDIKYFERLAGEYLSVEKLGQITVGLETGMESVGNEAEFEKQLKWLKDNQIRSATMSEFGQMYPSKNPDKIILGDWVLTPNYRENVKLNEKTIYQKNKVFKDVYEKDTADFLNRVYAPENLINKKLISSDLLIKILLIIGGCILIIKLKLKWWIIVAVGISIWMLIHMRYSVINGEKMIGFLVDNLRFVGINLSSGIINTDLSNNIAKSMLKIHL